MEQQNSRYDKGNKTENTQKPFGARRVNEGVATGFFLVLIGGGLLIDRMYPEIPNWIISWKTFLIVLGLFLGYKNRFRLGGWIAPIIIGTVFIVKDHFYNLPIANYIWPIALITLGLLIALKPKFGKHRLSEQDAKSVNDSISAFDETDATWTNEDVVETTNIFSGTKKINISKNFKGGEITNVFGGSELNLSKADIKGRAVLEVTCIFGGTKLIIPPDWSVQQEAVAIFGGIDDKRPVSNLQDDPTKILILKGTVLMGGIDIRSY